MGCFRSSSFFASAAGVSPAKRGEAQRSRERSDLDAPAAEHTVASERALARPCRPVRSLPRFFILTLHISFCVSDPKREPVFRMQPCRPHHLTSGRALSARTIIPHARGRRARVGGTILFNGVFQPGISAVTARPDPAKPSRSASLEWGQVIEPSLERRRGIEPSGQAALNTAPSGTTPWVT